MSFGGGFGGFGQSNNNQQSSGFGGFGSNTGNTTSAFGSSNTGAFGTTTSTATGSGGFGSGGFGSNTQQSSGFGSKPTFGASSAGTGGGLFGSSNTNTGTSGGFGGFGSGNTTNTSNTSAFGSGSGGGGLFSSGTNKPAFGSNTPSTGGSLFGGGGAAAGGSTGGGFGASNNPGIGGNVGDPPGTANTPFQAFVEREGNSTSQNSFQNILFQDPYKKWSSDELRLADYAQGRRHGNATGAGAFGVSSGFGSGASGFGANTQQQQQQPASGFGANTGGSGLFGSGNTSTSTGFGAQSNTGTAFGSSGGLFGQNKPATGAGMFGSTSTSQPAQSGGLFGGTTGGTSGFGSGAASTGGFGSGGTGSGGGLFGGGATQNKPSGLSFGNTGGNTTGGFGSTGTTGGFGSGGTNTTQSGGLFGGSTTQTSGTAGGGLFGGGGNQQQPSGFGSGTSGFGAQNQQKPGGLFGNAGGGTSTTGGLFGGAASSGGGFGASNPSGSTGTGLFGAKPATGGTGGGLFGGGNTSTQQTSGTGTGLFGGLGSGAQNQQQQQPQQQQQSGGGMFSSLGQNQPKPSLFGGGAQQPTGTGLFGGQGTQQQGSMFGSSAGQQQQQPQQPQQPQQQAQGSLFGGSILGGSQGAGATPQSLSASITDVSAYGTPSLFSNQGNAEAANPGPLATPLSSKVKPKRGSILPMYKLNPASARYVTPQKRGFGFSYSTYGTPGSASSTSSTPGTMGRSLLGASLNNRSLNKSVSASSLRRSFNAEDSILTPGAFSASGGPRFYGGSGSTKKLIINKDMRSDLFSTPTKDRPLLDSGAGSRKLSKRVSFDTSTAEDEESGNRVSTPTTNGATSASHDASNGVRPTTDGATPNMEEVKGNELAIVHEEAASPDSRASLAGGVDQAPGSYWMNPSKEEISEMNRMQRQKVSFVVGRRNVGQIAFKAPVDLSNIDLDDLFDNIVILETRSATVYPVAAKKPPVGKGLNVPSKISLEQSFPRGKDKRRTTDTRKFAKHVERLKRIENTTFESYDQETGIWTFSVEHFTTYGLDYDDESDGESMAVDERANGSRQSQDQSSEGETDPDDTFDFRQGQGLPGAFDQAYSRAEGMARGTDEPSFLGVSSAGSAPQQLVLSVEQRQTGDEYDMSENEEMTSASLGHHPAAEQDQYSSDNDDDMMSVHETPGGILRARMRAIKDSSAPVKMQVADGDDWMDMLQKTVSPQKRDRAQLRDLRDSVMQEPPESPTTVIGQKRAPPQPTADTRGFATSIDLMNSLFERSKVLPRSDRPETRASKGFLQWPYERRAKIAQPSGDDASDVARARWGPGGTLILPAHHSTASTRGVQDTGDMVILQKRRVQDDVPGVVMAKFSNEHSAAALHSQIRLTKFGVADGVPKASLHVTKFSHLFHDRSANDPGTRHEKLIWELASILFDNAPEGSEQPEPHARKNQLSRFWRDLVADASSRSTGLAKSNEEKAVASLAGHRVQDACNYLTQGKNYHLGTLVALIGTDGASKKVMKDQLAEWHNSNFLSEFTPAIRAIYEMLSGNVCVCEGKKGVPVEDRLDSFVISEKFQLNWKQAFGMRLWYGVSPKEDISTAVSLFKSDIEQEREQPPPTWFAEENIKPLWTDPHPGRREDLLWGLLKLYADDGFGLEEITGPENSQLSPVDFRLSWQLEQALTSTNKASYGQQAAKLADATTFSFASQLVSEGNWLEATFVLLHVTNPKAREQAIRDHLCRHASLMGPETGDNFVTLTQTFKIPAAWIWEAQALYMRSVENDATAEVQCLIRASAYPEAHRRLVEQVAPQAIIERDYQSLSDILSKFEGKEDLVADWPRGGEVYQDFLSLKRQLSRREAPPTQLLQKLIRSLPSLQDNPKTSSTYNTAAVTEMSGTVARAISDSMDGDQRTLLPKVLGLPLTEDNHLAHSVNLSLAYYKAVMAR